MAGKLEPERRSISEDEIEAELGRFLRAVEAVAKKLSETGERLRESGNEEEAGIFEAHIELAEEVAFFSIGTNDLVQYTLAADRGNERVQRLHSAEHPAVLKLVSLTCQAAREAGIQVGVCDEAAGDPALIPKLVELGVTELSMSAPSIPRAKKIISELQGVKALAPLDSGRRRGFPTLPKNPTCRARFRHETSATL